LDHPKLNLHKYLKDQVQKTLEDSQVRLDAFIISYTPYNAVERMYRNYRVTRQELEEDKHILFQYEREGMPNPSYVDKLFGLSLA
jgi:hypothetical protein